MAKMDIILKNGTVLNKNDIQAIYKVNKFFDLFVEMKNLIDSMTEQEYKMLERSLENTLKEMEVQK